MPSPSSARELQTAVGETLRAWWHETWDEATVPGPALAARSLLG